MRFLIFTAEKNLCILHRQVFVMLRCTQKLSSKYQNVGKKQCNVYVTLTFYPQPGSWPIFEAQFWPIV